ncbi:zinc-binding dehydrogenase [Georgenia halophila]|uniref:Zinc-binding dehydrogenase n=1 Tax=Georgenia halophila TaxID=620889 RepID=A0ABP8LMN8_9MICO
MKGVVLRELGGPEKALVDEVDPPTAANGEVVVRIRAAALNRRDLFVTYGQYPGIELPSILGSDGAGVVEELPPGYRGDHGVGDDVMILPSLDWGDDPRVQSPQFRTLGVPKDGTFAELVAVPVDNVFRKPDHLSYAEAAALPLAGVTAYRAVVSRGQLQDGETVLITGAGGGVAGFAIQFAAALGAHVLVTSTRAENLELATTLGAAGGIDWSEKDWSARLKEQGAKVDVVIDSIGGEQFPRLVRLLRAGGRLVIFGATAGPVPNLVLPHLFLKQLDVRGTSMGNAQEFADMLELVTHHEIHPHLGARFPLGEVADAMRLMEAGAPAGKIILEL